MPVAKSHSRSPNFVPDDRQREAIEHIHGPVLVVAGAGTGKTSVLVQRIAHLVEAGHARPDEILALTYTRNAANEMRERVCVLLGEGVRAATFHDCCLDLLKRAGQDFAVLDDIDLWIYLRRRIRELHLQYFVRAANVSQFLSDLLGFLSRCHDELVTPEKYSQYVTKLERGDLPVPRVAKSKNQLDDAEVLGRCREIARVFEMVERWLKEDGLGTFSHMITRAHTLLQNDTSLLASERAKARFILVDEFQDANFAQVKILAALAGAEANLFAVGDPDQAIYRFRGASSAAFELFHRHFPTARRVVLQKNRRSTTPILRCAFALIDKNPPVFAKQSDAAPAYHREPLQSAREEEAEQQGKSLLSPPVAAVSFAVKEAEGPDVASVIAEVQRRLHCKWKDFAVLYRSHTHRDDVIRELAEAEIPFAIENLDVSDAPEVRDLFACVRAVSSVGDDISLFRAAALPQFKVDPIQLRAAMRSLARDGRDDKNRQSKNEERDRHPSSLAAVLDRVPGGSAVLDVIRAARDEIKRGAANGAEEKSGEASGRDALAIIAKKFQFSSTSPIVRAVFDFVAAWQAKPIHQPADLNHLIEYLGYFREAGGVIPLPTDESVDAVRLMTVHLAKGLEFPYVFILRANSNSFPASYRETLVEFPNQLRDPDSVAEGDDRMLYGQEERRLFYVAMTRARDSLHIYAKQGIGKDKTPAGYVRELLQEASLRPWLVSRPARASQATIEIFAAASPAYSAPSRSTEWLDLPATSGLHARLSASAVDTYERCPLQFKLERDWRMPRDIPAAMQYGAAMHRVLRTYYDSVRAARPKTDDGLIELLREDLASAGMQDRYQHELYEKQGVEQLRDFLEAHRTTPQPEVLHTEESFEIRFGETAVVGRIDRIDRAPDGSVVILDYKTGKARTQEDADESLQLSIYALAAQEKWGYRVGSLAFHNLEGNVTVATRRSVLQLEDAKERVQAAAQGIAAGDFRPKVDFHCAFCPYRNVCPAKEKQMPRMVADDPRSK
ncbi:MAG: ATP-dependent DNA helicase [Candidatus Sulfotelmatobacter sp.]